MLSLAVVQVCVDSDGGGTMQDGPVFCRTEPRERLFSVWLLKNTVQRELAQNAPYCVLDDFSLV